MLHGRDAEAGVQPRVSTGQSIHAVPSITPSPREGIEIHHRGLKPDQAFALSLASFSYPADPSGRQRTAGPSSSGTGSNMLIAVVLSASLADW